MFKNIGEISDNQMFQDADIHAQRLYAEENQVIKPDNFFCPNNQDERERRELYGYQSSFRQSKSDK